MVTMDLRKFEEPRALSWSYEHAYGLLAEFFSAWLTKHATGVWAIEHSNHLMAILFSEEKDATLFKLTWC
jgi:hypothetical protein